MSHIEIVPSAAIRDISDNDTYEVNLVDPDTDSRTWVGRIAHVGGKILKGEYPQSEGWRIVTCGPLVPIPAEMRFDRRREAAKAAAQARAADTRHDRDETGLTPYERDVIDFEAHFVFPRDDGSRERALAELLGTTRPEHYNRLARLITGPQAHAALRYNPELVNRLLRRRERGRAIRQWRQAPA
jgi:hypothetical protein